MGCYRAAPRARLMDMACVLCGSADNPTDEDVVPRWLLRAFDVQGPVTVNVREESGQPQAVARRANPKVMLRGGLCRVCNNERLSRLENAVKPVLAPMSATRGRLSLTLIASGCLPRLRLRPCTCWSLPSASSTPASGRWRATNQVLLRSAG